MNWYFIRHSAYFLVLMVLALEVSAGPELESDSVRLKKVKDQYYVVHEVEEGETLYSISRRYGAKVRAIRESNQLRNRGIDIGQFLDVPIIREEEGALEEIAETTSNTRKDVHIVKRKETLYSIAKSYGVSVEELKRWNNLTSNDLDIGQQLTVLPPATPILASEDPSPELEPVLPPVSYVHRVQPGESIFSIARKYNTTGDSIRYWNDLQSDQISIGGRINIRKKIALDSLNYALPSYKFTNYGSKLWKEESAGVSITKEEGVAGKIEGAEGTKRILLLHRTLAIGTEVSVLNLMNNRRVQAKVVGKLPSTGLNKNLMLRLTPATFDALGIADTRSRVEISYQENE